MKITCFIIEDEPLSQKVLERYIEDVPFLEVKGVYANALAAMEELPSRDPDLLFLDINMPKLSGIDFLKVLKRPPLVIITTAYAEFAIQGYELDVVDYLMKPFSFERFFKAVQKVQDILSLRNRQTMPATHEEEPATDEFIFLKSNKKTYKVNLKDILYIEGLGDYVKVYTQERMIVTYQSLKKIEQLLSPKHFPRIHKSFIVNLARIEHIEGNTVKIRDRLLPVGSNFRADFEKLIRKV